MNTPPRGGNLAHKNAIMTTYRRAKLKSPPTDEASLRRSNVYREFLAEREEILRHKWLESEKAGHDIGYDRALLDWIMNHREKWRVSYRKTNK